MSDAPGGVHRSDTLLQPVPVLPPLASAVPSGLPGAPADSPGARTLFIPLSFRPTLSFHPPVGFGHPSSIIGFALRSQLCFPFE